MSHDPAALSHHPAPHADKLSTGLALFMLFGGPLAWIVQLCIGFALTSSVCFTSDGRQTVPQDDWGYTAAIAAVGLAAFVATAATIVSAAKFAQVRNEKRGGHRHLIEVGHGRTRFVALWGVILGTGAILATLVTLVAFALVSPCAG